MRHLRTFLSIILCVLFSHATFAEVHTRRVRSIDALACDLLDRGSNGSALFRTLVDAIENSDVIVYVQTAESLPHAIDGSLQFAAAAPGARYLRITVRRNLPTDRLVALIGHELTHAVEIARDRHVVDEATLRALYQRIGHSRQPGVFDTEGAIAAGYRVHAELITGRTNAELRTKN